VVSLKLTLLHTLGGAVSAIEAERFVEAEGICGRILAAKPNSFDALYLLGVAQARLGKTEAAVASYDRALDLRPDWVEALNNRGNALIELDRFDEALASYDRALRLRPDDAGTLYNRGKTLKELNRLEESLASYDQALELHSDWADALNNRGNVLTELGRHEEALASYSRALDLRPDDAEVLYNRGKVLTLLTRHDEALASYDRALDLRADWVEVLNSRGNSLTELGRLDEALACYDRALVLRPDWADLLFNHGNTLRDLNRLDAALESYDRAWTVAPDHGHAMGGVADCVAKLCELGRWSGLVEALDAQVSEKQSIVTPFVLLLYSDDPELQMTCAQSYAGHKFPSLPTPLWSGRTWRHEKLRIAYLSADFRVHAMAHLTAELIECHDRSRFEIIGVSFGPDDGSPLRKRIAAGFDRFLDVRDSSDETVARLLNDLEVDIAVDLMGYTRHSRPGILSHRPAPIQVNYLGYPGTMGAEFIDYVIADAVIAPLEHQPYFAENIVHLPDCYQANDSKRTVGEHTPTRAEVGLPAQGFVFCCFNKASKITPDVFEVWMRLLRRVENSVLWLLVKDEVAMGNLSREAQAHGIAPSRLVFAKGLPLEQHLARHRLADLFLDTLPYNAHTTASDALWMGLPVLTCRGEAFAARVAASLLHAIGLPELITRSLDDYEKLAFRLATEPASLSTIRRKLTENRRKAPLFDSDRFRRNIEAAYTEMWDIWQRGEAPRAFAVPNPKKSDSHRQPRRQRVTLQTRPR
jgi:predicted O-linked N-acetylglucosamine transferase (SPINDLY family)